MQVVVDRCCGLDVHQATVVACVLIGDVGKKAKKQTRTFKTFLSGLEELRDWLFELGVTHVAMESTGVYWKPVFTVLEDAVTIVVGNAYHIKNVPGRKTDVKDAEWIAELLRHGLIASSYVPTKEVRVLRDLMRYRKTLTETRVDERNRLLKLLETANIKLSTVATNAFGKSGMAMLNAIANGETDSARLAELAMGLLKKKHDDLKAALAGHVDSHHRFLLRLQLDRLAQVEADIARLDEQVTARMEPYEAQIGLLEQIPGIGKLTARTVLSELGPDLSAFSNEHKLAAWTGLAPGNNESAGKRMRGRTRKGNVYLKTALVEAATSAIRTKGSYIRSKYYRMKARIGANKAMVAIAHKLLIAVYHVLSKAEPYRELGEGYLDQVAKTRTTKQLVRRLEGLGYQVALSDGVVPI